MPSIIALAVLSAITAFAAPHGHNHFHLHPARSPRSLITHVDNLITPIAGRSDSALPLDLMGGTCGGSTGFGCGDGFCCSKWGYCGTSDAYCGSGCQFGNCNGTATGLTTPPSYNTTAPEPASYSSAASIEPAGYTSPAAGPVVTIQLTMTADGPAPVVTETTATEAAPVSITSTISDATISPAGTGIGTKVHGGPPGYSQSWESVNWGQSQSTSPSAAIPTTFATQVAPTPAPYSSVSVPAPVSTPGSTSVAAPAETSSSVAPSAPAYSAPAYSAPASSAAASSAPAYSSPAASASAPASTGAGNGGQYVSYSGDGTVAAGWPTEEQWMSFEDLWSHNLDNIKLNCDNSDAENADLKSAISSVSASSGVPANFIFAIIMQESHACVRVESTWSPPPNSIGNPGVMQSHSGKGSCNNNGAKVTPCPADMITQMVSDGVDGTSSYLGDTIGGPGLKDSIQQAQEKNGCTGADSYYTAARLYNSGSNSYNPPQTNLLTPILAATVSYPADIANRLMGYIK